MGLNRPRDLSLTPEQLQQFTALRDAAERRQDAKDYYVTLDSGERRDWETGARRDVDTGKPRYDLIPVTALRQWAELMGRGAVKYGDRNWEKGMPVSVFVASALRHFYQFLEGDRRENHLAAVLFNVGGILQMEEYAEQGTVPAYFLDEGASMGLVADKYTRRIKDIATDNNVLLKDIRIRHGEIFITTPDQHIMINMQTFESYTDAVLADILTGKKTVV